MRIYYIIELSNEVTVNKDCGNSKLKAHIKDVESGEVFEVIISCSDVDSPLEEGQLLLAELDYDDSTPPWDCRYYVKSIKALDKKVVGLRQQYYVSWIGNPYFVTEDGAESGFRARRDLILEIPHEQYNDEYFCSLFDEDVLIPLKDGDFVEATLSFQTYEWDGVGYQTIYATRVRKVK
jgi:hypothetical protein